MARSELRRGVIHTVAAIVRVWRGGWVVRVRCGKLAVEDEAPSTPERKALSWHTRDSTTKSKLRVINEAFRNFEVLGGLPRAILE